MKTVTLDVRSPSDAMTDFSRAWKSGKAQKSARISFAAPELLWQVLTAKRWELLKALCGAGPVSVREAARRVDRDVKAVHGDITALLWLGCSAAQKVAALSFRSKQSRLNFSFMQRSSVATPNANTPTGRTRRSARSATRSWPKRRRTTGSASSRSSSRPTLLKTEVKPDKIVPAVLLLPVTQ